MTDRRNGVLDLFYASTLIRAEPATEIKAVVVIIVVTIS